MPPPGRKMNAKQAAAMKAKRAEKAAKTGAQVKVRHAEEMAVHLKTFQEQLEAFAAAHKKQIATDPQFRAQFNRMCREVGVDPLQCAPSSSACYSALRLLVLPRPHAPATPSNLAPPLPHSQERLLGNRSRARRLLLRAWDPVHQDLHQHPLAERGASRAHRTCTAPLGASRLRSHTTPGGDWAGADRRG
jgi:hypothetical protein